MIYVFLGKEFNLIKKRVDELINSLNIENIIKYDYSESSLKEIIEEVNYVDLFNEQKLIIVSNFTFKKLKNNEEEILSKYINNMNENIIILKCIDDSLDERKSLTKLLKSKCKVEEIKKLDYKGLHEYITNLFKEHNLNATYNQIKRILDLCDYNPDYTINEVEKLFLYKIHDKELYDEDIDNVICENKEKEIFRFIENVMNKKIGASIDSYRILESGNVDEIVLLDSLEKQFRLLLQIKVLNSEMDQNTMPRLLGVNPYTIKKLYPFIPKYSEEDIANILFKLSEVDSDIKLKGLDKNKVFEYFLLTL